MPPAIPYWKHNERTKCALDREEMIKKAKHLIRSKVDSRDAQCNSLNYEKMEIDGEVEPEMKEMEKSWEMALAKDLKDSM